MERADGSVVARSLSFAPFGRIRGLSTRTESHWAIKYGKLHLIGASGQTTTYFHTENVENARYVLIGKYSGRNDRNWHILREISPVSQDEAYAEIVAKALSASRDKKDYFDFLLRILEPRERDPAWRSVRLIELASIGASGRGWCRLSPSVCSHTDTPTLFEFNNAEVLPHGGFVLADTAIDEFLFCTQPNWRDIGLAPIVAQQTPVAHLSVQSEQLNLDLAGPVQRVDGPHFWFGTPFALVNFGHFVHDLASQLIHVDRAKLFYGPRLKFVAAAFLAPGFRYPMQEFLFREFFGAIESVVFHRSGRLEVETLCAGSPVFWPKSKGAATISREALRHLSNRIRDRFVTLRNIAPSRRIYITRDDGRHPRNLENEPEVRALLIKRGFEPVTVSRLTPMAMIEKFYNAEMVVGAHGAGLMNVIFCDPDTVKLVELDVFPSAWSSITSFSGGIGLDYVKIPAAAGRHRNSYGATDIKALESELDQL
jgi:hypothetical protein